MTSNDIAVDRNENPRLFSYVVARDYGFAPNPFFRVCTLATCKPKIRATASIGDWIIGTGSSKYERQGYLVFAMRVTETMTFNEYWKDERFQRKKPNLRGSMKQAFGDNIYFLGDDGQWQQQDSHHSFADGSSNPHNIQNDTKADRVLCSTEYAYWGRSGPNIPRRFRDCNGFDICSATQGHKCRFPKGLVDDFVTWFRSLNVNGYLDMPIGLEDSMTSELAPTGQRNKAASEGTILLCDYMREIEPQTNFLKIIFNQF